MPEGDRLIYWDADVFLSYVNGMTDRLAHLDAFLEKSGKDIQIITSTISIVEVAFGKAEIDGKVLDKETEEKISRLWGTNSPIKLVEVFPAIGNGARGLMRYGLTQGWKLKPMDAIHLSTALNQRVVEFHTYNSHDFQKWIPEVGFKICEPISDTPKLPL